MRFAAGVFSALLLPAGIAAAGDYADLEILGFSPDGSVSAFEEYGVQDGSGFPYSSIYVVETATDGWVAGTPVRVQLASEQATLAGARRQARDKAKAVLARSKVGVPGAVVVSNPATELSADPHAVAFLPRIAQPASQQGYALTLTETTMPAADCPDMGRPFKGFALVLTAPDGGSRTLSQDTRIPASRRCPLGYAISTAVTFFPKDASPVLVVLLSVFSVGFEGQDRRFLAVATRLR